jgi:chorismate mutase
MPTISELRQRIDKIDSQIIKKLSQRKKISIQIGKIKSQAGKNIFDSKREEKMFLHFEKLSIQYNLNFNMVKKLFKMIISNSRKLQK